MDKGFVVENFNHYLHLETFEVACDRMPGIGRLTEESKFRAGGDSTLTAKVECLVVRIA